MDADQLAEYRKQRLTDLADKYGGKKALGLALGHRDGAYIGQMTRGERPITEKFLLQVEQQMPTLKGWFDAPGTDTPHNQADASPSHSIQEANAPYLAAKPAEGQDYIHVPLLANSGSMGRGAEAMQEDVLIGAIALSPQWVARRIQPTKMDALRFIHGHGDSMSPTYEDGDILLVDTGAKDPRSIDGVYVLEANQRLYIKRVRQRIDGAVEISSDNSTVKTVDVLNGGHNVTVLGRVVWAWNGRKL
jgi:phage repressor protein C with HTH and peptisase S24 domain